MNQNKEKDRPQKAPVKQEKQFRLNIHLILLAVIVLIIIDRKSVV